ncbi:ubiquitin-like protein [Lindgomyces ingoldianus]|nr:ubiquitin-like protein [Lindgomyces ingoldianus]KAF2475529.1 ubiquitin-like protein [Lindgomyces ingoldianus]
MPSPAPETQPPRSPQPPKARFRSRSRSPRREDRDRDSNRGSERRRSRSRSPPRRPKNFSGLKWKKHDRRDDSERDGERNIGRGYRAQEEDRRRRDRSRDRERDREDIDRDQTLPPPRSNSHPKPRAKKPDKASGPTPAAPPSEPMIIVTVNDRLGTKAQIPCFASDPVKVFKAMVSAKIGRPAHEIMLKRQGERPFKDHITLGDYGVSNGVQLDLELDTGD